MASFKVTLDNTLLAVMTSYTEQVLADAIQRIADKYGFDAEEAKAFLQSGGVVVKYPPLEREKLPTYAPNAAKLSRKMADFSLSATV